jgi:phospholipase C
VFPLAISMILLAAAAERPPAAAAAGDPLQQQQQRRQRQHHHAADDATADSGSSWGGRGVAGSSDDVDVQRARHFRALRDRLHLMTEAEAEASIASFPRPQRGTRYRQHKIDHFVVLFMENRAADHMFGCMLGDTPGFDGIPSSGHSIPYDPAKPSESSVVQRRTCVQEAQASTAMPATSHQAQTTIHFHTGCRVINFRSHICWTYLRLNTWVITTVPTRRRVGALTTIV